MINFYEVVETNQMIEEENLDVRTITLGISLMDCIDSDLDRLNEKIYKKITTLAKDLVSTGEKIESEFGIPIVNKRISITPVALVGGSACKKPEDFVTIAETLDKAAKEVGVNFIGGYSAIVSKGMTKSDELLIRSIPMAMAKTERVCSSVNVGSTKTGIDMDAVRLCGEIVKETAEVTKDKDSIGCAKFVVLCNAPDDNPFMAGAFLGVTEGDADIKTSQPAPGDVMDMWDKALEEYDEVVHIPMSAGLSSSCETAIMLSQDYDGKVQVVNNHRISVTQRRSVEEAKKLADAGKSAAEIKELLEAIQWDSDIYITVDTLKYLKKGGRLTPAAAAIGTVLNLKPVLRLKGEKLDAFAKSRGWKSAKKTMIKTINEIRTSEFGDCDGKKDLYLDAAYTGDRKEAQEWLDELHEAFPEFEIRMDPLSLSVACHIGPGARAVTLTKILHVN